jgi:hypothetical protein
VDDHFLTLAMIDRHLSPFPLRTRETFVGVQIIAGLAMLLVNDGAGSTKALVAYDVDEPVQIIERSFKRSTWMRMVLP